MFFSMVQFDGFNVKGTVNGYKNIKPMNLDALISMVWLGLIFSIADSELSTSMAVGHCATETIRGWDNRGGIIFFLLQY